MRVTDAYRVLLISGGACAAIALVVGTADAAKGSRDAMIEKCIAEAQASAPDIPGSGSGRTRSVVYKNCMTQAGFRP